MATKKAVAEPIKVKAIKTGFFGTKYRKEGATFTLPVIDDSKELTEKQFSSKWMQKV